MTEKEIAAKPPLVLAFIGDAVWTLYVRERLTRHDGKVGDMHSKAAGIVSAAAQSVLFEKILSSLTQTEQDIAKRARNAHCNTYPKNSTLSDYKRATAFEAVIGYNYLIGNTIRIKELLEQC